MECHDKKKNKKEELARWCYPALNVGDELTYWVLLDESKQLVARSNVRAANDPLYPNFRETPVSNLRPHVRGGATRADDIRDAMSPLTIQSIPEGSEANDTSFDDMGNGTSFETIPSQENDPDASPTGTPGEPKTPGTQPLKSIQDYYDAPVRLPRFSPDELIGRTFLYEVDDQRIRAKVIKKILDRDAENHQNIKMLISIGDDQLEELIAYNELSDLVSEQMDAEARGEDVEYPFRAIVGHKGPMRRDDGDYIDGPWSLKVEWENGETTWVSLRTMAKDDPITVAVYAKENGLLDTPGWKSFKRYTKNAKTMQRMVNASRRKQKHNAIVYKFGIRLPRNPKEAKELDRQNGNTYWQDAMALELAQLKEYKTFRSIGKNARVPTGYTKIPLKWVYDVKQSLKRKARLVARGDKTTPPPESVYSGVATLRSIRIVAFLAELNGLKLTGGDVGNAYLEAYTTEKICFVAGEEFGPLAGHTMIVDKALYGLRTSGARFHAKFADTLRFLGFQPTKADPDVWLRDAGDCYEYVVVYVDDIFSALKDPETFYKQLQSEPWNYKLKNVEEPKYHLGGDFGRDEDGTFFYGAQSYVKRLVQNYKNVFGELPPETHAPLDKDDKPELDTSPLLGPDGIEQYQSFLGAVQWLVTLCRFDIAHAVMSLSRFRAAPREGHLDRLKRLIGYLRKRPSCAIRFRTGIPDFEAMFGEEAIKFDWMESIYGCPEEPVDDNAPPPKGKPVRPSTWCDANLMHDMVTGRSASGIVEFLNQTPTDWFSKRQNQVESATYGSEFMVARQATERMCDLRYTLRSFGVPIEGPSWMFGDNQSVVTSSTIPHSALQKRWNALSYHKVREAIASGWLRFEHVPGTENCSDILTKPLPWHKLKIFVEPLLMWKGDTNEAPSPGQVTEGSITRPQPELRQGEPGANIESGHESLLVNVTGGTTNIQSNESNVGFIPPELYGNQYAALYDRSDYEDNQ